MEYKLLGGGMVTASDFHELAELLWKQSHTLTSTLEEFMEQTAERCKLQTSAIISTYNVEEFITDLIDNGFIIQVQE